MSDFQGESVIMLTHERVLCSMHGELLRAGWPEGFPTFMAYGFQAMQDGRLGQMPRGLEERQAFGWFELQFSEKPICCRLSQTELINLYLSTAKKWKIRPCRVCKQVRQGNVFRMLDAPPEQGGKQTEVKHVCLWCVVFKMTRRKPS